MEFLMQVDPRPGEPQWQCKIHLPTVNMAMEYTRLICGVSPIQSPIILWMRVPGVPEEDWTKVATYTPARNANEEVEPPF